MEKVHLLTLGCPKNLADSELMLGALTSAGFEITLDPEDAQVLLVNTCAFIEAAKKESLDAIMEAVEVKKRGAGKRLVGLRRNQQRHPRRRPIGQALVDKSRAGPRAKPQSAVRPAAQP